ncbi:unnamed protein product [Orchesella dallaii]|uniref:Uncharacterized protein n=1 Tax=Orchesella dallaii TaxID=48710 RepID=A0ABP1Q437_9HEXA
MELTSRPLIAQVAVADASTSSRSMPVVKANSAKGRIHRPWREKRTLKGKKAQNINPAKSLGKQKRFSTRKPAGAVALAPTNRVAADCDDPNDITFAPPTVAPKGLHWNEKIAPTKQKCMLCHRVGHHRNESARFAIETGTSGTKVPYLLPTLAPADRK